MRSAILAIIPVMLATTAPAQGVFSNKTQVILEKVIQDYPNHFYNIKGELISQALQSARYKSTLQLPGAESTVIWVSSGSQGSGWSCVVLETKSFAEARVRFATIYSQLSNSIITAGGQKTYILSGQYETPVEEKKVTCITFTLLPGVGDLKKVKVALELRQEQNTWKIVVCVDDKDAKDEPEGAITSN
jgi:hypothetical protein